MKGRTASLDPSRRAIRAGAIGNLIEYYDATIYSLLAPVFAQQFFPAENKAFALLYTYGLVVGVAFVVRPAAAMLLSPYGDRRGRRKLLSLSLFLMGSGLLIIGLSPTYRSIGVLAPVCLVLGRAVQNVSNSGEFQAACTFIVEHSPADRRATTGAVQYMTAGLGILSATLVATTLTAVFPKEVVADWAWRIPFLLGAALCLYGFRLRRTVPESPLFTTLQSTGKVERKPLRTAAKRYPRSLFLVMVIQFSQVTYFTWQVFLPTYAHLVGKFPLTTGLALNCVALAAFVLVLPLVGMVSDRKTGRRPLIIAEALGFAILAYPMLRLLQHPTPLTYLLVAVAGNALLALTYGNVAAVFCELFPTGVRTSGVGLAYNVAVTVFGGSAPILATWTIANDHPLALAYYIVALEMTAAIIFLALLPETRGTRLETK
ncbi:MFS transporter [Streptomyces sp. NBC_00878]|uniref:MFS transporter n=1 Tax=Streptomyces sp. NBC_00878 TaxID=2975854 RepID=UPI00224E7EAC|nr:MFS transporter [Streptomyces sp. NBC_00878]MCX4903551.1 MFS transporter [Streptomyces sp. NBC_00878]